jgi:hypothetical protein
VTSGIGSIVVSWTPITNNSPVTTDVHLSTSSGFTPSPATLAASMPTTATVAVLANLPGTTTALTPSTTYYVVLVARDVDGSAPPSSQASGSPRTVTGPDLAANSVTANNIVAGTITAAQIAAATITAAQIAAGTITGTQIAASTSITSPIINGGQIISTVGGGGRIDINATAADTITFYSNSNNVGSIKGWNDGRADNIRLTATGTNPGILRLYTGAADIAVGGNEITISDGTSHVLSGTGTDLNGITMFGATIQVSTSSGFQVIGNQTVSGTLGITGTTSAAAINGTVITASSNFASTGTGSNNFSGQVVATQFQSTSPATTSGTVAVIASNGVIAKQSSSRRYKKSIRDITDIAPATLLNLRPRRFEYRKKDPVSGQTVTDVGFIAEEAAALGLEPFVRYDERGRPDGFHYDRWTAALQIIVQHQARQIAELTDRVDALAG